MGPDLKTYMNYSVYVVGTTSCFAPEYLSLFSVPMFKSNPLHLAAKAGPDSLFQPVTQIKASLDAGMLFDAAKCRCVTA